MSNTYSATETYSVTDIQKVVRRVRADMQMIAASSGGVSESRAASWANDIETLAEAGYLNSVDLTLFSNGVEKKAVRFTVNTEDSSLSMSRPGGVTWPRLPNPDLRIILFYTDAYTDDARAAMKKKLESNWTPTTADTSHSGLKSTGGRDYYSKGYGMQRKDYSQ